MCKRLLVTRVIRAKRLVCQYPQVARYKGTGNPEDTASYVCK